MFSLLFAPVTVLRVLPLLLLATPTLARGTPEAALRLEGGPQANLRFACGFHRAANVAEDPQAFLSALSETNFDPCCLGSTLLTEFGNARNMIGDTLIAPVLRDQLHGVYVGVAGSASILDAGYFAGREFVIFYQKGQPLRVAVFRLSGFSAAIGLPVGVGITQGIIAGACAGIRSYEGYFKTEEYLGYTWNFGMDSSLLKSPEDGGFLGLYERLRNHVLAERTNCDSVGIHTGLSSALVGLSGSYYEIVSPIVAVTGERTQKLQAMFSQSIRDAESRAHPKSPGDATKGRDWAAFHGATCQYEFPAQAWDFAPVMRTLEKLPGQIPHDNVSR